ncbi:Type-1 glutamine synthetase [Seminavis robusta]|uniref:Type-1 glutamine synthetase n=1 Tax=Seminavis robusta TaxID=568900 RepID=A0A9N8DMW0_9STRA|nr:Type-1 glutamine synthetase [Seminavis robusta]|eukprot:Sro248_g098450.1 Type-1 glutamine synthetase (460) ;mRNA; r:71520-72899
MCTSTKTMITSQSSAQESAATTALLRSLQFSGVQFLRFVTVDACNNIRSKVKPVKYLLNQEAKSLDKQVSIAAVCFAGLPHHADYMVDGSGMDARNVLSVQPDLGTFRVLPYAPKSAIVMGNLMDQYTDEPSPFCTRTVLRKVVEQAAQQHNIAFSVGVELEFCLVHAETGNFVDQSVYGNTTTLNQQEDYISELYEQLEQQYIPVELIHSESGPGQLEVVLQYCNDPVELADRVLLAQETIRAVARKYGFKALFAPKYDMMKAGNGMHVHMSIRNATTGKPLFTTRGGMSAQGGAFVEGILRHLPALMGLSLPTVNSFRRVGKGCWTGSSVGWALEDKESSLRVCSNLTTKEWDHVEYKLCDSTCNLYLALSGLLSAGLEGIAQEMELRPALGASSDEDAPLPQTVQGALEALKQDELLIDVIGERLGRGYLALRREEAGRSSQLSLEEEVSEFLQRA